MGGANLEVFKFGLYLFVPVFALLHFGDPQWYHDNVLPVRASPAPRTLSETISPAVQGPSISSY
jgi:protein PET100